MSKPVACLNPLLIRVIKLSRFTLEMKIRGQWFKCLLLSMVDLLAFHSLDRFYKRLYKRLIQNRPVQEKILRWDLRLRSLSLFNPRQIWNVKRLGAAQPFVEWRHRDVLWSTCRCYVHQMLASRTLKILFFLNPKFPQINQIKKKL